MTSKHSLSVCCRAAERDCELQALAALRAQAFYAYPPERAFAGRVRQSLTIYIGLLQPIGSFNSSYMSSSHRAAAAPADEG